MRGRGRSGGAGKRSAPANLQRIQSGLMRLVGPDGERNGSRSRRGGGGAGGGMARRARAKGAGCRKERRQMERQAKKQKAHQYHQRRLTAATPSSGGEPALRNAVVGDGKPTRKKLKRTATSRRSSSGSDDGGGGGGDDDDDASGVRVKQARRETVDSVRRIGLLESNQEEDKIIEIIEKEFKMRGRKGKIRVPKSFTADGLDFLLDVVDPVKRDALAQSEGAENVFIHELHSDTDDGAPEEFPIRGNHRVQASISTKRSASSLNVSSKSNGTSLLDEHSDNLEDNSEIGVSGDAVEFASDEEGDDSSSAESASGRSTEETDSHEDDAVDSDGDSDSVEQNPTSDDSECDGKPGKPSSGQLREDIYGRLVDSRGNVVKPNKPPVDSSSGLYQPPARRSLDSGSAQESLDGLRRQVKGMVNRLSETNIQSIVSQFEAVYRSHPRAHVTSVLSEIVVAICSQPSRVAQRLCSEIALLVGVLHVRVGSEVGGHLLETLVRRCNAQIVSIDAAAASTDKQLNNFSVMIANLFFFRVVTAGLVFDIMDRMVHGFGEAHIEVLVDMLKTVGFALRKDDPVGLKGLIQKVQSKAAVVDKSTFQDPSRVGFMLETLTAVKNNNVLKIRSYDPEHAKKLLKLWRTCTQGHSDGSLRVSFDDLMSANENGRWWLVGSAFQSAPQPSNRSQQRSKQQSKLGDLSQFPPNLVQLAARQRMNSDLRRVIFCHLMSADGVDDAFERLTRLRLSHEQEREIVHVIVDCCLQERQYNQYYATLLQRFCTLHKRYQTTFRFLFWDKYKLMAPSADAMNRQHRNHLGQLTTHLLATKCASLSMFKNVEFSDLRSHTALFLRKILTSLLLDYPPYTVTEAFERIAAMKVVRESLKLFIRHFVLERTEQLKDPAKQELLKSRVALAEKASVSNDAKFLF